MKLYISKLITIFFAFIIFNSSIISTSQKIQKNKLLELLLVNKESISKNSSSHASTKLRKLAKAGLDNAEFVINALASSGIPVISTIVKIFRFMFEAKKITDTVSVKVEGLEDRSYPCTIQTIGNVYNDALIQAKIKAGELLNQAKFELKEACLNFGVEYTESNDKNLCFKIQAKLKQLEAKGNKLLVQVVLDELIMFINDPRSYKTKLKSELFDIFIGEYYNIKLLFAYEGILGMKDLNDQEDFFKEKSKEIYNKLLNQHNEGLNLISIANDGTFGALRNFNCNDIEDDVTDSDKIGIATKVAAIWTAGGFMRNCVAEVKDTEATKGLVLGVAREIVEIVLGIVLSLLCFGIWKFVKMALHALKSLYYFYQAYKTQKNEPNNIINYSKNLGKGVGNLVNIVVSFIKIRLETDISHK